MEKVNFGYSTKNIPTASPEQYTVKLIEASEKLIKNMRWKAFFLQNQSDKRKDKENYGFNSRKPPPQIEELRAFEEGINSIIKNLEFKNNDNNFQRTMRNDIKKMQNENCLYVKADKTTNYYKVKPDEYKQLLAKNIHKTYKKAEKNVPTVLQQKEKEIAEKFQLCDRIETIPQREAYITLKDHKPNFLNNPACRLINPTKSELGKVSRQILKAITNKVQESLQLNLWRNTTETLKWFSSINKTDKTKFITFDIVDFYPSIDENLFKRALDFGTKIQPIKENEMEVIFHTKQNLLFNEGTAWTKKENEKFDITMGSFDGAESCELVGLYLLHQLKQLKIDVGLYRDDGLAVTNSTPRQTEETKKRIAEIFKENNLKLTIEANKRTVNYLDVTLDLNTNMHMPYKKPNDTPCYVNTKSSHPQSIIRNIPQGINNRLSTISSNEKLFIETTREHQAALTKSGYKTALQFQKQTTRNNAKKERTRERKIIWFNPPFSKNVKTNIGKEFLKLLDICFPVDHKLNKIFNRNKVKLSYACMPNLKTIIDSSNKRKLKETSPTEEKCNCRDKEKCPLPGTCQVKNVVYQATVSTESKKQTYVGVTETEFKMRYNNHQLSFKHDKYRNNTELSKHIWKLKDRKEQYRIDWKILRKTRPYDNLSKICRLCLTEKFFIMCRKEEASLNTRVEHTMASCKHREKFLLSRHSKRI